MIFATAVTKSNKWFNCVLIVALDVTQQTTGLCSSGYVATANAATATAATANAAAAADTADTGNPIDVVLLPMAPLLLIQLLQHRHSCGTSRVQGIL